MISSIKGKVLDKSVLIYLLETTTDTIWKSWVTGASKKVELSSSEIQCQKADSWSTKKKKILKKSSNGFRRWSYVRFCRFKIIRDCFSNREETLQFSWGAAVICVRQQKWDNTWSMYVWEMGWSMVKTALGNLLGIHERWFVALELDLIILNFITV